MSVARQKLMTNFSRSAKIYERYAHFQHAETARVFEALGERLPGDARIADLGCGTGYFAQQAREQRPHWQIIGLDLAWGMCQKAVAHQPVLQADMAAIPLADASIDAVVSTLCLQWVDNLDAAFGEIARIVRPGGIAVVATLGPENLWELKKAAKEATLPLQLLTMRGADIYRIAAAQHGLVLQAAIHDQHRQYYPNVRMLLDSMRRIGAGHNFTAQPTGLRGASRWKTLVAHYETWREPQGLPGSWDRLLLTFRKPL